MPLMLLLGAALAAPFEHSPPTFLPEIAAADPVTGPQIRLDQGGPLLTALELTDSDIVVEAYAGIARITQQQWFAAPPPGGAAAYLLPLPDGAVVDHAALGCEDRQIDSVVVPRTAQTQQDGKRIEQLALLDEQDGETFSWRLARLCEGPLTVTVQYTVALPYDGEHFTLSLPGPQPQPEAMPWAGHSLPAEPPPQEVTVYADAGMPLGAVESGSDAALNVRLCGGERVTRLVDAGADGVWLSWSLSGTVATHHRPQPGEPGTVALTLSPETLGELPRPLPRELLFVVDRSCSMAGEPFSLASAAVLDVIDTLMPGDAFNLYRLHGGAPLFGAAQPPSPASREAAAGWLEGGAGEDGGVAGGLRDALQSPPAGPARVVALLTDGHLDAATLVDDIDALLGESRIYPIGLSGYANRALLDWIAARARGEALYPTPQAPAPRLGRQLSAMLAPPTLTDVRIDWGGLHILDQQPARPRDVSSQQPLRVFARYTGEAPEAHLVRVHGKLAGAPVVLEVPLALSALEPHHEGLTTAWASQRIAAIALDDAAPQAREAITALAVEHGLVTRYTSLVSIDDADVIPVIDARPLPASVPAGLAALEWVGAPRPPARPPRA
ncbi:MAG: Ca-activated chloride channel family protein, partial [Myxococcota bacterium]